MQVHQVVVRRIRFGLRDLFRTLKPAQYIRRLGACEFRGVQRTAQENLFSPLAGLAGIDQRGNEDRSIDYDAHRRSASRLLRI